MTVRQENGAKHKAKGPGSRRREKRSPRGGAAGKESKSESPEDSNRDTADLAALLHRVRAQMLREDFAVRCYLRTMLQLQRFMTSTDETSADGHRSTDIERLQMMASALSVLSEGHYAFGGRRGMEIGDFYAQKSLDVLEGAAAPPQAVWRETLYVLMLRGQFRTERAQFAAAHSDLHRAHRLLQSVKNRDDVDCDGEDVGHFEVALLHHLIALHDARGHYVESVRCSKQLVPALERRAEWRSSLEAKAWLSCTLMLCTDDVAAVNEGRSMYRDIVVHSERQWAAKGAINDGGLLLADTASMDHSASTISTDSTISADELRVEAPYRWYTYFAVHFVAMREWTESYQLVVRMVEWRHDGGRFDVASTHRAFERYTDYLRASMPSLTLQSKAAVDALMVMLHRKQMEVIAMLMDELRTGKWRKVDGGGDGDGDGGGGRDGDVLEDTFSALKVERAPNIVATLCKHILIFRAVGNRQKADEILFSAVTVGEDRKWLLNRQSVYFAKFETVQFGENDVRSLLTLC